MSSKLAHHLQKHLMGEVLDASSALEYFATDGSVLKLKPTVVVYPRNATDVRKAVRFSWQLAEKGKILPITARGKGTDQAGAALGGGIMMVFPAHMNQLIELNQDDVTVQPGMIYGDLQRTLHSHELFLPPFPSSIDFCTIGGAIANNAAGEKTLKYGPTRDFVESLDVVLSTGQLITATKLSKRELSKKKGQQDFEGEIYRQLDGLLTDNWELIKSAKPHVSKNSAGYALWDVKDKNGSFDLSKLLVGSQGTLGVVTAATLRTEPYNPDTVLIAAYFSDLGQAGEAITSLQKLGPSAMEIVDKNLLAFIKKHNPEQLKDVVEGELPQIILLVEFDDMKRKKRRGKAKKAVKLLKELATEVHRTEDKHEQEMLWKIRHSAAAVIWMDQGKKKALPIIEDGVVPIARMTEFLQGAYDLFAKYKLDIAVWGHGGDANFHMQPFLDLSSVGDRQVVFKIMNDFYQMVMDLGGSTCGEHNDGRLRAPYLPKLFGDEVYNLFREVKKIFDPHGILNPGVKIDVTFDQVKPLLRKEYGMQHLYDHMPLL